MTKVYNTAQGKKINMDNILLQNEHVIAVGNQKVNARGDQLGPGGKVIKTRDQVMREYYALNTPVAEDNPNPQPAVADVVVRPAQVAQKAAPIVADVIEEVATPIVPDSGSGLDEADMGEPEVIAAPTNPQPATTKTAEPVSTANPQPGMRGSLASSVAAATIVTQKELLPPKKANGIQRF